MLCSCNIWNSLKGWLRAHLFRIACIIVAALLGPFFVCLLFMLMEQFYASDSLTSTFDNLASFLDTHPWSLITGLAAAPSLLLTWYWRDKAKRKELEQKDKDLEIAQESQFTDRFVAAVKLLGDDKLDARMGGIYALGRLSDNSETDHWAVMETLSAFIRERSPWPPKDDKDEAKREILIKPDTGDRAIPVKKMKMETDIQAALTVIGERDYERRQYEKKKGYQIDLSMSDLRGANFAGAHLEGALFAHSNLEGVHLHDVYLKKAKFIQTFMRDVDVKNAHLEGAEFFNVHMDDAKIDYTYLDEASMFSCFLTRADICHVCLSGTVFNFSHLEGVRFLAMSTEEYLDQQGMGHLLTKPLSVEPPETHLEDAIFRETFYNSETRDGVEPTKFPKGFEPEDHSGLRDISKLSGEESQLRSQIEDLSNPLTEVDKAE